MYFNSLSELLAMGGYASYVWSAFGFTFLCLLVLLVSTVRRHRRLLRDVRANIERQARIKAAKKMENTL